MTTENMIPPEPAKRQWLPRLRSRWWTLVLGLSLMANLLVGGLAVGHFASGGAPERIAGITYIQLIPRSFFHGLSFERRREFMKLIRERSKNLRNLRDAANTAPGVGLGLALSQRIAKSLNGQLRFEPTDCGARFVLDLPIKD